MYCRSDHRTLVTLRLHGSPQMYGKFLEDLQDNTGLAMQYFQEAERLEVSEEAMVPARELHALCANDLEVIVMV